MVNLYWLSLLMWPYLFRFRFLKWMFKIIVERLDFLRHFVWFQRRYWPRLINIRGLFCVVLPIQNNCKSIWISQMRLAYSWFILNRAVQSSWNLLVNLTYYLLVIYVVQGTCYMGVYQQIDTYAKLAHRCYTDHL